MRFFLIMFPFLISIDVFALEITCFADYHVLAIYEDSTGKAIDREQSKFILNYEKDKTNFHEIDLHDRKLGALTGSIYDSKFTGGSGDYIEGVMIAILNPATEERIDTVAPLESRILHVTSSSKYQPGILPQEKLRHYFWTLTCRW